MHQSVISGRLLHKEGWFEMPPCWPRVENYTLDKDIWTTSIQPAS